MKYFYLRTTVIGILLFWCTSLTQAGFPLIFPFLTTGWYYKPGPVESIVLGLIVVKVLAIRLGATLAGVPYHLNDIFDSKLLPSWNKRGKRYSVPHGNLNSKVPLSAKEMEALERILLALKRIDSHDCFIRYVCTVNQNHINGKSNSPSDETWLNIFRLRPKTKKINTTSTFTEKSIWDIYGEALRPEPTDCGRKYSLCPLSEQELSAQSILAGIF